MQIHNLPSIKKKAKARGTSRFRGTSKAQARQTIRGIKIVYQLSISRPSEGGAEEEWSDPTGRPGSASLMAAALDESQLKASKLDLDNARLRVDLARPPSDLP